jgi:unsaturated chondroitin disaccharide hydrolase
MNLDLLFEASALTGDLSYSEAAIRQAEVCMRSHVREDFTTFHVVNFDPDTGEVESRFTHQGAWLYLFVSDVQS